MKTKPVYRIALYFALVTSISWTLAYAEAVIEPTKAITATASVTLEQLKQRRQEVTGDISLTEAQKTRALDLLDRAIQSIDTAEKLSQETTLIRQRVEKAPARISELILMFEQADKEFVIAPEKFVDLPFEELSILEELERRKLELARENFYRGRATIRDHSIRPVANAGSNVSSSNTQASSETNQ